ncbi:MAG: hypothetical protein CVT77_18830 [Alphaproteobacteria bacterium HGW-Alphaproteobacteria-16]|nr:MAG: hypothetical protein CVT77_18830 [Alphaproteobacteria bacterium HGW-Alphaproteobacteria-16]
MARWQFELDPIPASAASIDGMPAIHLGPEVRAAIPLGLSPKRRAELVEALGNILPVVETWSADLRIWGNTRESDVQLYHDEDMGIALKIRIDAKTFTTNLVEALCDLATAFDWVFLTDRGAVLQPQPEIVLRALLNSPARRFVENPGNEAPQATGRAGKPD